MKNSTQLKLTSLPFAIFAVTYLSKGLRHDDASPDMHILRLCIAGAAAVLAGFVYYMGEKAEEQERRTLFGNTPTC